MTSIDTPTRRIYSVTELNTETKALLESRFVSVFVRGEVSNFSAPRSGHWYFTLKDASAQLRIVMFKNANLKHKPLEIGDEVIIGGQMSFYRERGEIQIIAQHLRPAGLGDLQEAFDILKKKLLTEGLFDKSLKQPLPPLPRRVAVVTSATGSVVEDIIRICQRRAPWLPLLVLPVRVQGTDSEQEICRALEQAQNISGIDLIIVARGGGSLEDLSAFNSEVLARAIAKCRLPVISAVGHETDMSISDFVADQRAATPSEAAELATQGHVELKKAFQDTERKMYQLLEKQRITQRHRLDRLKLRLLDPIDSVRNANQMLDYLVGRLDRSQQTLITAYRTRINDRSQRLTLNPVMTQIRSSKNTITVFKRQLRSSLIRTKERSSNQLTNRINLLEAYNPLHTMTRGYGIVSDQDMRVVTSVTSLNKGQEFSVELKDGSIKAVATEVSNNPEKDSVRR